MKRGEARLMPSPPGVSETKTISFFPSGVQCSVALATSGAAGFLFASKNNILKLLFSSILKLRKPPLVRVTTEPGMLGAAADLASPLAALPAPAGRAETVIEASKGRRIDKARSFMRLA